MLLQTGNKMRVALKKNAQRVYQEILRMDLNTLQKIWKGVQIYQQ